MTPLLSTPTPGAAVPRLQGADAVPGSLQGPLSSPATAVAWFVPGRIEVLGKHTDYAGGRSLLAAASHGITFTGRVIDPPVLRVTSEVIGQTVEIPYDGDTRDWQGHWAGYPAAVCARLRKNFGDVLRGAEVTVSTNLPLASGMSSSSAMIVGLAHVLMDLSGIESLPVFRQNVHTTEELAHFMACIENGQTFGTLPGEQGVGTFGGSEDHTGMMCCHADRLSQYSFCPTRLEREVPFPEDHSFVIAVSGVLAEKSGRARDLYNRASLSTREIVALWNQATGRQDVYLADAVRSGADAPERIRRVVAGHDYLPQRFEQFLTESEQIVGQAGDALAAGDMETFGELVDLSQKWTDEGLDNQVPQTRALARLARRQGAVAASAFGAGFGGSVWALVPTAGSQAFAGRWLSAYAREFPETAARAVTLVTRPGAPARRLALET